jgi:RNA polymerase sigma-54 factor
MILLKDLFTEGVINQVGNSISNRVIQMSIADIVKMEDRKQPYTDQQLVTMLNGKGINVARRTVTKYREHLQIPMSQMRRMWAAS